MSNAVLAMSGPTKIIELDGKPRSKWRIEEGAMHLWEGKLWRKDVVGCVLCVEQEGNDYITFARTDDDGAEHCHCVEHGPLDEVKYSMVKQYTVTIGGVVREGEEVVNDSMLFPASMSTEEKDELINKLLDEADREENGEADPLDDE
jgi:hypothetical protein